MANDTKRSIIQELNAITIGAIRELASEEDGEHHLAVQFGISRRTVDAVKKLRIEDVWKIVDQLGDTFLFAARNADDTLFRLIRSGIAENDIFILAKLRTTAASKTKAGA
jgi:hypothetical protein